MEKILNSPGLHHIAEDIFLNLDRSPLSNCSALNQNSTEIFDKPTFWLKKLSLFQPWLGDCNLIKPWKALIHKLNDVNLEKSLAIKLRKIYHSRNRIAVGCQETGQTQYVPNIPLPLGLALQMANAKENKKLIEFILENVDPKNQVDFFYHMDYHNGNFFKIAGPPKQKFSPMHIAAHFGYIDVVKNLITKLDNPNAANDFGITPIQLAAMQGHLGIVNALMVSVGNPNISAKSGSTPIHFAAIGGHRHIVESLKLFTDKPNAPNNSGDTPSKYAKMQGHFNLSSFLEKGSNPNLREGLQNWMRENTKLVAVLFGICLVVILFLLIPTFKQIEERRMECQKSTVFIQLQKEKERSTSIKYSYLNIGINFYDSKGKFVCGCYTKSAKCYGACSSDEGVDYAWILSSNSEKINIRNIPNGITGMLYISSNSDNPNVSQGNVTIYTSNNCGHKIEPLKYFPRTILNFWEGSNKSWAGSYKRRHGIHRLYFIVGCFDYSGYNGFLRLGKISRNRRKNHCA